MGATENLDLIAAMQQAARDGDYERWGSYLADDTHVCVIGKVNATRFPGNDYLEGADKPYSTYQCTVYTIADGKVAESTSYVNWLDPYVQVGLVDPSSLTRR